MVTVLGPGGMGKTRIVIQIGANLIDMFPDGVWFVDLVGCSSPESILASVGEAVGIRGVESWSELVERLRTGQKRLFILDNAEHLLEEVRAVTGILLQQLPGLPSSLFLLPSSFELVLSEIDRTPRSPLTIHHPLQQQLAVFLPNGSKPQQNRA